MNNINIQVRPWVITAGKVITVSAVGALIYTLITAFDARVAALEQRPIAVYEAPTVAPSVEPTASPSATVAPVLKRVNRSVVPSVTVR